VEGIDVTDSKPLRTERVYNRPHRFSPADERRESRSSLAREVGPVVYFIRTKRDLIKIGFTTDIATRHSTFGSFDQILALQAGTIADEKALHVRFSELLADRNEYFRPGPDLLAYINTIRSGMGIKPVAAW